MLTCLSGHRAQRRSGRVLLEHPGQGGGGDQQLPSRSPGGRVHRHPRLCRRHHLLPHDPHHRTYHDRLPLDADKEPGQEIASLERSLRGPKKVIREGPL
jgi:hypothetical protein